MASFDQIDDTKPLSFAPMQYDLDNPGHMHLVPVIEYVVLSAEDTKAFVAYLNRAEHWKKEIERDLQCISEDLDGNPFLTTWMPLTTFRNYFCSNITINNEIPEIAQHLYKATRAWRDAGCEVVDFSFYKKGAAPIGSTA